jgi:16S rRNA (adenine1518-N6/adenine1519-N6)-dimethyltransferase
VPDPSDALPPLRAVIAQHGLSARKGLGQHFLFDLNLTRRIARAGGDLNHGTTVEIGPGPGGLTRGLLAEGAAHVLAIEVDRRCLDALAEVAAAYPGRLTVVETDAIKADIPALCRLHGLPGPIRIVANLPYNISTPLLLGWLRGIGGYARIVAMVQKEVADRLIASPGSKCYGRLSVAAQWRATVRRLFDVDPAAFTPPPKVTSTVVELEPRPAPLAEADPAMLEKVVAAAFGQRRKMLRASLRTMGQDPEAHLTAAGIDPTRRAETLSIEEFAALARTYASQA